MITKYKKLEIPNWKFGIGEIVLWTAHLEYFLYRFDENNDGAISHKEMKKFVKDIQSLLTPSDLENISEHNLVKAITKQASVPSVVEF